MNFKPLNYPVMKIQFLSHASLPLIQNLRLVIIMQKSACSSFLIVSKKLMHEEAHPNPHPQPLASLRSSVEDLFKKNKGFKEKSQLQNGGALFRCMGLSGKQINKLNLCQTDATFIPQSQINEKTVIDAEFHRNKDDSKKNIKSEKEQIEKVAMHESAFVTLKHLSAGALSAIVSRCVFSS